MGYSTAHSGGIDRWPGMSSPRSSGRLASLYANGLVDHIVDERDDASLEPQEFCRRMALAIEYELGSVAGISVPELVAARAGKYRNLGNF
jgi:acyl-CoA carboxylase subunit beta